MGKILNDRFGVQLDTRWQRHDWVRRPLEPEALAYARLDIHYLLTLPDQLLAELNEKGRLEAAREYFAQVARAKLKFKSFDPDRDLWRVKGV